MKINLNLIFAMLCTCICLQASQVVQKRKAPVKQATPLELQMIEVAADGLLTKEKLQQYLKLGADVNAKNNNGYTALMWASTNGHVAIVQQLISAGADIDAKNNYDFTALMWASANGRTAVVQQLIAAGADQTIVNGKDNNRTARDGAGNKDVYDQAVAAGLAEWDKKQAEYRARQPHAKTIIEKQQQLIPSISNIIAEYAYGPSPLDLPPAPTQEEAKKEAA